MNDGNHLFDEKKTGNKNLFLGIWLLNKIFFWRSSDLFWPPKKSLQKNRLKKLPKLVTFAKENGKNLTKQRKMMSGATYTYSKQQTVPYSHFLHFSPNYFHTYAPFFVILVRFWPKIGKNTTVFLTKTAHFE